MIVTTTPSIEGKKIVEYRGIVFGETFAYVNVRWTAKAVSLAYENAMIKAKGEALDKLINNAARLGANAVAGLAFNFIYTGQSLSASATGTAVIAE